MGGWVGGSVIGEQNRIRGHSRTMCELRHPAIIYLQAVITRHCHQQFRPCSQASSWLCFTCLVNDDLRCLISEPQQLLSYHLLFEHHLLRSSYYQRLASSPPHHCLTARATSAQPYIHQPYVLVSTISVSCKFSTSSSW